MSTTTPKEDINRHLKEMYDPAHHDSVYNLLRFAMGVPQWEREGVSGSFPHYNDFEPPRRTETATSRDMLNIAALIVARYGSRSPDYKIVGENINKLDRAVLGGWLKRRSEGTRQADGNWQAQHAETYLSADLLGMGYSRLFKRTLPSGQSIIDLKHTSTVLTLKDRTERDMERARMVAFVHYLPKEEAEARYGANAVKKTISAADSGFGKAMKMVRIIEYWDIGVAKGKPTYALIAHDLDGDIIAIGENPFGFLPVAWCDGWPFPGSREKYGRLFRMSALQERRNQKQRRLDAQVVHGAPTTEFDASVYTKKSAQAFLRGDPTAILQRLGMQEKVGVVGLRRDPGTPIDAKLLEAMDRDDREWNEVSGTNTLDRGNFSEQARTLGENEMLAQRSDKAADWMATQYTFYHQRVGERALHMSEHDTLSTVIPFGNRSYTVNEPGVPESRIGKWVKEADSFQVLVGEEDLTPRDAEQDNALRARVLMERVGPFAKPGGVSVSWLITELLKTVGVDDPREAMDQQQAPGMGNPMAPGQGAPSLPEGNPLAALLAGGQQPLAS